MLIVKNTLPLPNFAITTPDLTLTPATESFADEIFREFTPEITTYMIPKPSSELEETLVFLRTVPAGFEQLTDLIFTVTDTVTDEFLGIVGLHERGLPRTPELGVWIKKSAHGKRIGQRGVAALVSWATETFQLDGFIYPCDKRNTPSRKIPQSLGGEVIREQFATSQSGTVLDEVVYFIPNLNRSPLCIGHRGACGYELENSRASFLKAAELGVDWIEFDVQFVDGEWFVFHDARLERVTDGAGFLANKSAAEIRSVRLQNGESIPTLKEVIELLPERIGLNIECKSPSAAPLLGKYLRTLPIDLNRVLVTSFDHPSIAKLRAAYPGVPAGVIIEGLPVRLAEIALDAGVTTLVAGKDFITKELVFDCRLKGVTLYTYTVNEPEWISRMLKLGVDGIIGNYPDRIADGITYFSQS